MEPRSLAAHGLLKLAATLVAGIALAGGVRSATPVATRVEAGAPVRGVVAIVDRSAGEVDAFHGYRCAGVVIGLHTIVTAAHCVVGVDATDLDILLGVDDLCVRRDEPESLRKVERVEINPAYVPTTGVSDTAILVVALPIDEAEVRRVTDRPEPGGATALGWSSLVARGSPGCQLIGTTLTIVGPAQCPAERATGARRFDSRTMICALAGAPGQDTCFGDSGGPLIVGGDKPDGAVAGVVSWGSCEGVGFYAALGEWILDRRTARPTVLDICGH
jgi:secreted trypsin-like serine protease